MKNLSHRDAPGEKNDPSVTNGGLGTRSSRQRRNVVLALLFVLVTVVLGTLLAGRVLVAVATMGRWGAVLLVLGVILLFMLNSSRSSDSTVSR